MAFHQDSNTRTTKQLQCHSVVTLIDAETSGYQKTEPTAAIAGEKYHQLMDMLSKQQ